MHIANLLYSGLLMAVCTVSASGDSPAYQPKGQLSWDYWFAKQGDTYYAFYLQASGKHSNPGENSTVGMATSKDLVHWTEYGTVLEASPKGHWNDKFIATGSVWRNGKEWLMLFTGHTFTGEHGMGLARSLDLRNWSRVGDGPVKLNYRPFTVPEHPYWQEKGFKPGDSLRYTLVADPYVIPEAIDGWHYMVGNAFLDGVPDQKKGAINLMRTRDGKEWEDCGLIACPMEYERMETPQLWKHGKRWYMYFGSVFNDTGRGNCLYISDSLHGPFVPSPTPGIQLPDGRSFYIAKVLTGPDGKDYMLGTVHPEFALSRPYAVNYGKDGSIVLRVPDPTKR